MAEEPNEEQNDAELQINKRPKDDVSDEEDDKEEEIVYKKIKKKESDFEETTKEKELEIGVAKIVDSITNAIGLYASGGDLIEILKKQIKETVINITWSTSEKMEDICAQFFEEGHYLFLLINRDTSTSTKGVGPFKSTNVTIKCKVKFFYAEAGNEAATKVLNERATAAATDAFEWIDSSHAGKWE